MVTSPRKRPKKIIMHDNPQLLTLLGNQMKWYNTLMCIHIIMMLKWPRSWTRITKCNMPSVNTYISDKIIRYQGHESCNYMTKLKKCYQYALISNGCNHGSALYCTSSSIQDNIFSTHFPESCVANPNIWKQYIVWQE